MTGRETGANARPAIIRIASSRRMAKGGFTTPDSHRLAAMERSPVLNLSKLIGPALITIKLI